MTESNEPTSTGPNAQDRMAKARAAKAAKQGDAERIAQLEQQLREAEAKLVFQREAALVAGPTAKSGQRPGTYVLDKDGRPVNKLRWSREIIEQTYEKVTFVPMLTISVRPHGITRGEWQLEAGKQTVVPTIVKDIHDNSLRAIQMQTEAYKGWSGDQERTAFEATRKSKAPHFSPVQHIDYGWPLPALEAQAKINAGADPIDPSSVGHEPELGFPGGYGGKPLNPEVKV